MAKAVRPGRKRARSTRNALSRPISRFARPQAFPCSPDAEAVAVRTVRNVAYFRLLYALVLWVLLLATLAPARYASMLFLMASVATSCQGRGTKTSVPEGLLRRRTQVTATNKNALWMASTMPALDFGSSRPLRLMTVKAEAEEGGATGSERVGSGRTKAGGRVRRSGVVSRRCFTPSLVVNRVAIDGGGSQDRDGRRGP